jgi:hypothetical protein
VIILDELSYSLPLTTHFCHPLVWCDGSLLGRHGPVISSVNHFTS